YFRFESSDRFSELHFKLVVSEAIGVHFVFLNVLQGRWLANVLEIASGCGWKFPKVCFTSDFRRKVEVAVFRRRGVENLVVTERCSNGKTFFVLIPTEAGNRGWWSLLKAMKNVFGDTIDKGKEARTWSPGYEKSSSVSYVEAVKGTTFTSAGKCSLVEAGDFIRVDDAGVKERMKYLERCVVFRVSNPTPEPLDWITFRRWMTVNWGVNGSAPVKEMGDDLWLLECPSKEDASRILRLDRFYFGSSKIRLDIWLPGSGRSEVLRKQGLAWITASGIPLHLLSQDLYKQIGDRCGGFIEANTSLCPLGSVRLKISCARDVPRSVSLRFLDEFYSIPIVLENGGFGALVEKEVQRTVPEVPKVKSSCKVSQGIPCRWRLVPGQSSKGGEIPEEVVIETAPESGSQVGRFKVDGGVSEVLGLSRVAGELTPSSMEEGSTEGTGKVERGKAREPRCDSLSTDGSVLYPAVFERQDIISIGQPPFSDLRLNSNAGMSVMARKFPPTQTDILEGFFVPLGLGPRNHALFFKLMLQPCSISLGLGSLGQLSSFWSKP
ncbi:hypothetical protein LINGRAHAP2_LOCUS33064, partial [Linum grandiflorum]